MKYANIYIFYEINSNMPLKNSPTCLNNMTVWIVMNPEARFHFHVFFFFFFFFLHVNSNLTWVYCAETKITIYTLFITVHSTVHALKNIKNGSHDTIYTFKNYFAIVLSIFSNNKLNSNGPNMSWGD